MSGFRPRFFVPIGSVEVGETNEVDRTGEPVRSSASPGLTGAVVALDAEDSHHARTVLRLQPGDEAEIVVEAAVYAASVLPAEGKGTGKVVRMQLGSRLEGSGAGADYRHQVVLVQALVRPSALEWSIEKSIETGASLVLLVPAAGSPRSMGKDAGARQARWARIAREAAKQSKQPAVPTVEVTSSFTAAHRRLQALGVLSVLLDPGADETLFAILSELREGAGRPPCGDQPRAGASRTGVAPPRSGASPADVAGPKDAAGPTGVGLWVGPEGGWTTDERQDLLRAGVRLARLGHAVLRTETAGPVAVAVARLALGDW